MLIIFLSLFFLLNGTLKKIVMKLMKEIVVLESLMRYLTVIFFCPVPSSSGSEVANISRQSVDRDDVSDNVLYRKNPRVISLEIFAFSVFALWQLFACRSTSFVFGIILKRPVKTVFLRKLCKKKKLLFFFPKRVH